MRKWFELIGMIGVIGYLVTRFFFYEYKTLMFSFAGLAIVGLIGRLVLKPMKNR
ncbi:hypothetical protein [Paenibacillus sambharensis]|uniref:hypothetical protein n=1 Tax=Paenibacillus sambharensis TaxID=1803190 RepID=UPI0015E8DC8A|nr:hypothetical protein [Paenibacillus sambharensis]